MDGGRAAAADRGQRRDHVLAEPGIADEFAARFRRSGSPRDQVTLEISEASLLGRQGAGRAAQCAERGLPLAIDDFGTGYASFAYLKELAVDVVKIDRTFVRTLQADPRDEAIVGSIGFVAERLGLRTVAEGVEQPACARACSSELGITRRRASGCATRCRASSSTPGWRAEPLTGLEPSGLRTVRPRGEPASRGTPPRASHDGDDDQPLQRLHGEAEHEQDQADHDGCDNESHGGSLRATRYAYA